MLAGAHPTAAFAQAPRNMFATVTANGNLISNGCSGGFFEVAGQDVQDHIVVLQAGASALFSASRLTLRPYRIVKPADS